MTVQTTTRQRRESVRVTLRRRRHVRVGRTVLVDPQRVDLPVGLRKRGWVVLHVTGAATGQRGAATGGPDVAGPVTAEGDVEDLTCIN
jgi:hypothetical protein